MLSIETEMQRLVQEKDWSATPLGPRAEWPPALGSAVDLILELPEPAFVIWGKDLVAIYNDGYRQFLGDRHPAALGRKLPDVWPELMYDLEPRIRSLFDGRPQIFEEQEFELRGEDGSPTKRWFRGFWSPLRDDMGNVAGVFGQASEVTLRIAAERARDAVDAELRDRVQLQRFLLEMRDALRPLVDPVAIRAEACRLLSRELEVSGACFVEINEDKGAARVEWPDGAVGALPVSGEDDLQNPGWILEVLRRNECQAIPDTQVSHLVPQDARPSAAALGIIACMCAPLVRKGRLIGAFCLSDREPRDWTEGEAELLVHAAEMACTAAERACAEAAKRESEERFRQFANASSDVLWIRNAETLDLQYVNSAFSGMYGLEVDEALRPGGGQRLLDRICPEDLDIVMSGLERIKAGETIDFEFRTARSDDGSQRWLKNAGFPLRGPDGRIDRIGGIIRDITEEKHTEDRLRVLVGELQHRTRNLLGVVKAVSRRTMSSTNTLDEFAKRFHGRLGALARVNDLLSKLEDGERVTFGDLLAAELESLGLVGDPALERRVSLSGPSNVQLRSRNVQTLALALHELMTNASKHGAFADPNGRLEVAWTVDGSANPQLVVDWRERGLDLETQSDRSADGYGFGRELIEKALPHQLGAETSYELRPDGLRCRIVIPVFSKSGS